jgi:hypothetical protein
MHAFVSIGLLMLAAAGADKPSVAIPSHVRATQGAAKLLELAASRSPTVRELMARLALTDVIVYVEMTPAPQVPIARTKLVTATAAVRFLRIGVNTTVPLNDVPALIAHELQHAVEIAEQADVRDDGAVRRLYARIGRQHGVDSFETDAAVRVERRVRDEMRRLPAS